MLNRSLENQVRKYLGQSENLPENLAALLSAISASYDYYDKDRALLKRSIEISSTEMIELNNSLRRTNHELNQLFNNVGEVLYTIDTITNKIIQISSACEKLYGYTVAEFCADPQIWLNVMHPDDLHLAYEYSKELVKGMQVQNQCRIIRKDASIRWIESSIIPTLNTEGQLIRVDGVVRDITEKKKAEEEILLSSARLKKAQEVAHVGSWDLDFATAIAIWSDEACRIYGLLPTENKYTYEDWISFVHPGDLEYVLAEIKKSQVALTATSFEHRIIRKDGSIRWIHSECIYQYNAFGKPVGLHGITHDVTERKKTEQGRNLQFVIAKLLSQSTNMAEFMSNVLQAICENLNWNLATVWMVDESAEVLRYADCWHSPGEANTDFITSSSTFTFAKGSGIPGYVWQTGKTVWVEDVTLQENFLRAQLAAGAGLRAACIFPIQNEGKVMGVVEVLSHEIKELDDAFSSALNSIGPQIAQFIMRKKAEEMLLQSEANLRTIFENADVGFLLMDTGYNVVASNEMISQWSMESFGTTLAKGMNLREMLLPEKLQEFDSMMGMLGTGEQVDYETKYPDIDGSFKWLHINGKPVKNEKKEVIGLCLAITNITLRKQNEEEIVRLNESLEEKVKTRTAELLEANKELEAFSYSVSHDLRAPLRIINGFGKMLLKSQSDKLDAQAQIDLQTIMVNATRMGNLIDDLLNFSRLGRASVVKSRVNMTDIVKVVIEEVKAGTGCEAEIDVKGFQYTNCDPALMKQVWSNLISNAVKYSRKKEKPIIEIGSTGLNGHQTYYIKDNGAGFDMQHKDKLFAVFQRLHKVTEYEGTGVGLALVQRIISKHGGKIWADGKVEEGATFYFTLTDQ